MDIEIVGLAELYCHEGVEELNRTPQLPPASPEQQRILIHNAPVAGNPIEQFIPCAPSFDRSALSTLLFLIDDDPRHCQAVPHSYKGNDENAVLFGSNYLDVLASFSSFTSKYQSSFRNTWNDQSAFIHAKIMASEYRRAFVRKILKRLAMYSQASLTEISMLCTFAFSAAALMLAQLVVAERTATSSGEIIGHRASNRPAVMEYLGIPFARSPTGELRSCPYVSPTAIIAYPNKTVNFDRIIGKFLGQGGVVGEDCLTLNVWSKHEASLSPNVSEPGKPVMVFFYGGRFAIGATNNSFYNGQYLADGEDVVVVTVNYRTNIFGFPGAPNATQNLGLLDQRLALEWIRTNVAAFSGDSARVTIFGQSAGGVSVDYHSFAFAHDPIAAGLISHSGTAFSFIPNTAELAERCWRNATAAVGCASGNGDEVMQCMRAKDFTEFTFRLGKRACTRANGLVWAWAWIWV
ncbi:Carboxylesterase family-domain-containing protein [Mycena albidolilacea]|uniref:Carboxylesterase family-domain-containing protein n=1 Tax=Mycena albidolilacea TaxID=1033008 RepID=A0AAD7ED38_9AGAR|nr:Carboxylesterase family-domain-containing protein [Mycena albidolilacea]